MKRLLNTGVGKIGETTRKRVGAIKAVIPKTNFHINDDGKTLTLNITNAHRLFVTEDETRVEITITNDDIVRLGAAIRDYESGYGVV